MESPWILTNAPGRIASPTWRAVSEFVPSDERSVWRAVLAAWRLYRRAGDFDCVVLGSNKTDFFYALLRSILPVSRPYTVKLDCLWYLPSNRLFRPLKSLQWRLAARGIDAFVVWASREIEAYSAAFGIPAEKFHFLPYHDTLNDLDLDCRDERYVFSGGNYGRDYATLFKAVDGLPVRVEIGSTRPELFRELSVPPNVHIRGYSHQEYLQKLAGCSISVVSLQRGDLHSGGQQTFLNSMALGKPTIVTDPEGAADYIRHGKDGLLVEPGDPHALRAAIVRLLEDFSYASRLGDSGRKVAKTLSTEAHFRAVTRFAGAQISEVVPGFELLAPRVPSERLLVAHARHQAERFPRLEESQRSAAERSPGLNSPLSRTSEERLPDVRV